MVKTEQTYYRYSWLTAVALGLCALAIPLLRDLHIESALIASLTGCLWAGWITSTSRSTADSNDLVNILPVLQFLYLFSLPLFIYTLATGCFSLHGLGFWLLYPVPGTLFGASIGRLIRHLKIPYARWMTIVVLMLIAIGGLLLEFYSLPQVYFYNHVWGGWPGPIYDETVQVTWSLVYFRIITCCWILLLWNIPVIKSGMMPKALILISIIGLTIGYSRLPEAGIVSPPSHLQRELGGVAETTNFSIYYDRDFFTESEIEKISMEHEFYLEQIRRELNLLNANSANKIESYLYAHPWQKKELVGAKFTSYVPVWLRKDQLHIAKPQLQGSLKHEMVHVLAKEFGNKLINASWSIGLIEGLAVAVARDQSRISTIDQIVVSEEPLPDAAGMKQALSPLGFYGGRSTVNYTTSGSFVRYLLNQYPVSSFKEAYRSGNVERAYRATFHELVEGWHRHLETVRIDSVDRDMARRLFSIPSLFEKACPHILTEFAAEWDNYRYFLAERDTVRALQSLDKAYRLKPENLFVKSEWTFMNLKQGNTNKIIDLASRQDTLIDLQLLYADAFAMEKDWNQAASFVQSAKKLLDHSPDSTYDAAVSTRSDREQWTYYLNLAYEDSLFAPADFEMVNYRTKIRMLEKAIEQNRNDLVRSYAELLYGLPLKDIYFDTYENLVHHLAFLDEFQAASSWINKIRQLELRARYIERIGQQKEWLAFQAGRPLI